MTESQTIHSDTAWIEVIRKIDEVYAERPAELRLAKSSELELNSCTCWDYWPVSDLIV